MWQAVIISMVLVLLTSMLHFNALKLMYARLIEGVPSSSNAQAIWIMSGLIAAHLAEIILYAVAYWASERVIGIGALNGLETYAAYDYLYFSAVSYTSLGIGDVFPTGHIRFITGIEALNGLLLIAASASFMFFATSKLLGWKGE